jgi:archaellin
MDRKAIMGIGTLIIFIATILVAAVAAGVIISTSGVLQQKALIIGEQSQHRLINGIQITHVFMAGNVTDKTANNIEILARPEPASGPINFKTTTMSFFTDTGAYSATLSHPAMVQRNYSVDVNIGTTYVPFGDLDGDGIDEQIRLVTDGGVLHDFLRVNMSMTGESDDLPLGVNIDAAGHVLDIRDLPIRGNGTIYGYIHMNDSSSTAGQIVANTLRVTDEFEGGCTFAKLRPETRYCIVTVTGRDDTALEYGETVYIYFRLTHLNRLAENDEFEIKIFPQDGRSTYILDRVPQVIYKVRMSVYP